MSHNKENKECPAIDDHSNPACMCPPSETPRVWEWRFDDKWPQDDLVAYISNDETGGHQDIDFDEIKSFIRTLLAEERAKVGRLILEKAPPHRKLLGSIPENDKWREGYNAGRAALIWVIEEVCGIDKLKT